MSKRLSKVKPARAAGGNQGPPVLWTRAICPRGAGLGGSGSARRRPEGVGSAVCRRLLTESRRDAHTGALKRCGNARALREAGPSVG